MSVSVNYGTAQNNVITQVWTEGTGVQSGIFGAPTAIDGSDNIYRAGFEKLSNGGTVAKLQKIDNEGQLQWTTNLDPTGTITDKYEPSKVVINGSAIYVSGIVTYTTSGESDFFISKVNASGTLQWLTIEQESGNDVAADMMYDAATSQIYICGTTERNGDYDMLLAAYNDGGSKQWLSTKDYNGNADIGAKIYRDGSHIVIQGSSQNSPVDWDIATWFYTDGGSYISHSRASGLVTASDELKDGAMQNNHILLTGKTTSGSNTSFKVVCLDANNNLLWQDTYSKNGNTEEGLALTPATNGFVTTGYVTASPGNEDILVRKYDLNGNALWNREMDVDGANDRGMDIIEDSEGNYIVISDAEVNGQTDVYMHCLEASTGDELWSTAVAQDAAVYEKALSIEAAFGGDIYVTYEHDGQIVTESYSYSDVDFPMDNEAFSTGSYLIRNSGQLRNSNEEPVTDVRYYTFGQHPETYYSDDRISALVSNWSTNQIQRIDFDFINANTTHVGELVDYEKETYFNYFQGSVSYNQQGTFEVLAYPSLYSDVDAFVTTNSEGFKMVLVLESDASLNDIEVEINGSSGFVLNGGNLEVSTISDPIDWSSPHSYSGEDEENADDGCIEYVIIDDHLKLINTCGELTYPYIIQVKAGIGTGLTASPIDNLEYSSFWGGDQNDGCFDLEVDANGNWFLGGYTTSLTWPTATGMKNNLLSSSHHLGLISKISHNGEPEWHQMIKANKRNLPQSLIPKVSIKGVGVYDAIPGQPGTEVHFVGEYYGELSPVNNYTSLIPTSAYKQTNSTISESTPELFFGTLKSNGEIMMVTPFGGDDVEEVHAMDISSNGLMYFVGSTMSDGDHSAIGSRSAPSSGHPFPVFNPQDDSFFESTHPYPGNENRGFVSVIDLNPNSANRYQLAYSSIITKDPGITNTNTPYEAIYDINLNGNINAYCGKGISYARLGTFGSGIMFAEDLDQQFSEWTDKTYFCSALAQGINGGIFIGIDEDGVNEPLETNGSLYNMHQTTTGESYLVKFGEASIIWDTYLGQGSDQISPWTNGPALPVQGYADDISGRGALSYNATTSSLFLGGSAAASPVDIKSKGGYLNQSIIDANGNIEDLHLNAFTTKGINHNYHTWGTMFGGEGAPSSTSDFGKDFCADIASYDLNGDTYVVMVSNTRSWEGDVVSNPEKFPVAKLNNVPLSYFKDRNHNPNGWDITISRFKVTDIDNVVSLDEVSDKPKAWLYPNPVQSELYVALHESKELTSVQIIDVQGRLIFEKDYPSGQVSDKLLVNFLERGVYLILLNNTYAEKFIKD